MTEGNGNIGRERGIDVLVDFVSNAYLIVIYLCFSW